MMNDYLPSQRRFAPQVHPSVYFDPKALMLDYVCKDLARQAVRMWIAAQTVDRAIAATDKNIERLSGEVETLRGEMA